MNGRDVAVRLYALQSLNQFLLECVGHLAFQLMPPETLMRGGMDQNRAGLSAEIAAISRLCSAAAGQMKVIASEVRIDGVLGGIEKIARIA